MTKTIQVKLNIKCLMLFDYYLLVIISVLMKIRKKMKTV